MRARWAVPAALAVVLACAPARAELRARTRDLGAVSPVVSLLALEQGGSADWGAGIPTPTIDCAATGTSSSASLQCSGATPTFAGVSQTAAGSPWWYRGDSAVRPAIALNGSTDYWSLGDTADPAGSLVICFSGSLGANVAGIVTKDNGAQRSWGVTADASGNLSLTVFKSGGGNSTKTFGTLSPGNNGTACVAYAYVSDGSSIIRGNVNGTASTDLTNAVGPIVDTTALLRVGYDFAARYLAGGVRRVAIWTGADAPTSAAQLAQMVATQWGLAADKPAGTVATHARTDSTLCCPFSDAECYWLGPGAPCIHAPTYQGWASGVAVAGGIEVYGIGQNKAVYSADLSQAATWVPTSSSGNSISAAKNATGPDGVANSASTVTLTGSVADPSAAYNALRQTVTVANGTPHTFSAWFKAVTYNAPTFPLDMVTGGVYIAGTNCPVSAVAWTRCSLTGTTTSTTALIDIGGVGFTLSGLHLTVGSGTILVYEPQLTPTAYPVPPRSTPGASSYTGTASTATTLSVPLGAGVSDASAAMRIAFKSADTTYSNRFIGFGGTTTPLFVYNHTALGLYDSTNLSTRTYASWTASPQNVLAFWGGNTMWLDSASGMSATIFDGSMIGASPTVYLGSNGSLYHINGIISRFAQCRRAGGCR